MPERMCPCGSSLSFADCCGPIVSGQQQASTADELMRSRYTAYAVGNLNHIFRTWHPSTRPAEIVADPQLRWTGLQIHDFGHDWVHFTATYVAAGRAGTLNERSRFAHRHGRWEFLDGDLG